MKNTLYALSAALLFITHAQARKPANTPATPMGNTKSVITDVSKAIKKDAKEKGDKKAKKEAKKTEKMAKDEKECPPEEKPVVTKKAKSPIDGTPDRPKKVELFFNAQLLVVGKNGEQSFQEVYIPRVNYSEELGYYASRTSLTREQVLALPEDKRRQILLDGYSGPSGEAKKDAVDNAMLIAKIAATRGEGDMYGILSKEMAKAPYGKKVDFLANFLSYLNDNYDFESLEPGKDKDPTDKEIMSALDDSIKSGRPVPAGVCRHMHQLAVRMAQAMGIKEAFGVGFRTHGGGHRTLVLTSPDDPTKVIQLNYGSKSENNGVSGPSALSQNHTLPDTGIKLRIFNGKDDLAIQLPSDQGDILNKVTGGEDKELSPDHKSQAQIQQVGVGTPYGTVRFFHAKTPMGNQTEMMGGAYNIKVNYNDVFYGEYGIAGFTADRPVQGGTLKTAGAYGQTTQGFNLKVYSAPNVNISTFGELHLRGSLYCSSVNGGKCEQNQDSQVDLYGGILARYRTGPLTHRTSLTFQATGDTGTNSNGISVNVPVVKLSHDTDIRISSSITGNLGGGVTMYNLGTGTYFTYNGHGGIESKKTGTYFGVEANGRLTNSTPFWIPGAEHTASAVVNQSIFGKKLYVGAEGKQSFDLKDNHYLGITLGGTF